LPIPRGTSRNQEPRQLSRHGDPGHRNNDFIFWTQMVSHHMFNGFLRIVFR
jgi:hypothetical protein